MAISLLQEAQTRGLAAALAGMTREEADRAISSLTPPLQNGTPPNALYPALQHAAAFGMLAPAEFMVAKRQAAAAYLAASIPNMPTLATTLFSPHPAFLSQWSAGAAAVAATAAPHLPPLNILPITPHSPPDSPNSHSPVTIPEPISPPNPHPNPLQLKQRLSLSPISSQSGEGNPRKTRKLSVKKNLNAQHLDVTHSPNGGDSIYHPHQSSGTISPPSSGSSPNTSHDVNSVNSIAAAIAAHGKDNGRDKNFTCKICSRSFGYKHVLQNHERTHTGEKPFECTECHKRFTRDHHLKTHMRLHTGEKPYHCSHCDRQFVQVANLRRHLRVHTGERPYICEVCDGKFSDSNQLKSHMLVHNGEKPFQCEHCNAKFRRRHHVINHKCNNNPTTRLSPPPPPPVEQAPPTPETPQTPVQSKPQPQPQVQQPEPPQPQPQPQAQSIQPVAPQCSDDLFTPQTLPPPIMSNGFSCSDTPMTFAAEESIELSKYEINNSILPLAGMNSYDMSHMEMPMEDEDDEDEPLDLSEDVANMGELMARARKAHDIRRVFRLPPQQITHVTIDVPEQTEPEDLSMHSPRPLDSSNSSLSSGGSDDDIEIDEIQHNAARKTHLHQYLQMQRQVLIQH